MAPNAHILYVGAQNCIDGLFDAEQNVIDNGLANVVTNSWGDDAGDLLDDVATKTAYDDLFMLADSTGMSVLFSSGDNGDNFNLFGFSSADYPTESPFVTAVGGTSLKIGAHGQQTGQLGWATGRSFKCTANVVGDVPGCTKSTVGTWLPVTYDGGSGGFTSYNYTQPWYQAGVVPAALALRNEALRRADPDAGGAGHLDGRRPGDRLPHRPARDLPERDRSSTARPGTAGPASPRRCWRACIADADQAAGVAVGFINPAIYKLDGTPGAIDDILPGGKQAQIRVDHAFTYVPGAKGFIKSFRELTYEGAITYCDATGNCATRPNTLTTAKGYDSMTGLGSIGPSFVSDLARS